MTRWIGSDRRVRQPRFTIVVMACSSCGQSRGRGPRSPQRAPMFVVMDVAGQPIAQHESRAEAAREVRQRNALLDQSEVAAGHHFRWELRRVALDGSDELGDAIRTSTCVGCADGKIPPVQSEA